MRQAARPVSRPAARVARGHAHDPLRRPAPAGLEELRAELAAVLLPYLEGRSTTGLLRRLREAPTPA